MHQLTGGELLLETPLPWFLRAAPLHPEPARAAETEETPPEVVGSVGDSWANTVPVATPLAQKQGTRAGLSPAWRREAPGAVADPRWGLLLLPSTDQAPHHGLEEGKTTSGRP